MKKWVRQVLCVSTIATGLMASACYAAEGCRANGPNIIIIFTDDQGYQDVGCNGAPKIKTPHLDRMAKEGMRFTDFYSAAAVCSPSRAALLTGCYPPRVGVSSVLFPYSKTGLNPAEITLADLLKPLGYQTTAIGKWHIGHQPEFLPTNNGFDSYFGIPYSNDMWAEPTMEISPDVVWRAGRDLTAFKGSNKQEKNIVPLLRNTEVVEYPADQSTLTRRYTDHAIEAIDAAKEIPFFIYLAHSMPHIPLYASPDFEGKSAGGLYGDVIEEIDFNVGRILEHLKTKGLADHTLVIFTSDNGPWNLKGDNPRRQGGAALPLRGYKFQTLEGGMREPCIMWWPGKIPAGQVCPELASTIDLLPTIARLTGATVPTDRIIDGKNIWPLMSGVPDAESPHENYFYYHKNKLQAVRQGDWKLRITPKNKKGELPVAMVELYNLRADIGEANNLVKKYPERVTAMQKIMELFDADLKANSRPAGQLRN